MLVLLRDWLITEAGTPYTGQATLLLPLHGILWTRHVWELLKEKLWSPCPEMTTLEPLCWMNARSKFQYPLGDWKTTAQNQCGSFIHSFISLFIWWYIFCSSYYFPVRISHQWTALKWPESKTKISTLTALLTNHHVKYIPQVLCRSFKKNKFNSWIFQIKVVTKERLSILFHTCMDKELLN